MTVTPGVRTGRREAEGSRWVFPEAQLWQPQPCRVCRKWGSAHGAGGPDPSHHSCCGSPQSPSSSALSQRHPAWYVAGSSVPGGVSVAREQSGVSCERDGARVGLDMHPHPVMRRQLQGRKQDAEPR